MATHLACKNGAMRAMSLTMTAVTLAAVALVALAPATSATHAYTTCSVGSYVCVEQSASPFAGPACSTYAWNYAHNADYNEARVNAGGASATAGGQNACDNWFFNDADYQGVYVRGSAAGKSVDVSWYSLDVDYHWPGAPADYAGTRVTLIANDGSGETGVRWGMVGTSTCVTILYVQGSPTFLPCPAGAPPAPPGMAWGLLPY